MRETDLNGCGKSGYELRSTIVVPQEGGIVKFVALSYSHGLASEWLSGGARPADPGEDGLDLTLGPQQRRRREDRNRSHPGLRGGLRSEIIIDPSSGLVIREGEVITCAI